jgi:hypothetical protein
VRNPARDRSRNLISDDWESPCVNAGEDVNFYRTRKDGMQDGDRVDVYPISAASEINSVIQLQPPIPEIPRFIMVL